MLPMKRRSFLKLLVVGAIAPGSVINVSGDLDIQTKLRTGFTLRTMDDLRLLMDSLKVDRWTWSDGCLQAFASWSMQNSRSRFVYTLFSSLIRRLHSDLCV